MRRDDEMHVIVVQFYPWFKLYYLFFWRGVVELWAVMYDNECKTKGSKIFKPRIKLNLMYIVVIYALGLAHKKLEVLTKSLYSQNSHVCH